MKRNTETKHENDETSFKKDLTLDIFDSQIYSFEYQRKSLLARRCNGMHDDTVRFAALDRMLLNIGIGKVPASALYECSQLSAYLQSLRDFRPKF